MGKAEIISEVGAEHGTFGIYVIKRLWGGRDDVSAQVSAITARRTDLQIEYNSMPESTPDEIFAKSVVKLQIAALTKRITYLNSNFPADQEVTAHCADLTGGLTGEVGTIDIPGEYTDEVNIVPGYEGNAVYDEARDGDFHPAVAMGAWSALLAKMILPGVQKWRPKYRYGYIVPDSIDYDNDTCAVTVEPAYSSQQNIDVNQGDGFGTEVIDVEKEIEYFRQDAAFAHSGFTDFCSRNPSNPI